MSPRKPKYVFARVTTLIVDMSGRHRLKVGDAWYADHPVVQTHSDLFADDPTEILPRGWVSRVEEPVVEQATKAPGEKRATRRAD